MPAHLVDLNRRPCHAILPGFTVAAPLLEVRQALHHMAAGLNRWVLLRILDGATRFKWLHYSVPVGLSEPSNGIARREQLSRTAATIVLRPIGWIYHPVFRGLELIVEPTGQEIPH